MFHSRCFTLKVAAITTNANATSPEATRIVHAVPRDQVVLVRNVSFGQYVLISYEPGNLMSANNLNGVFKLPAGASDRFVVATGQGLYAASPSTDVLAEISCAVFEAIPTE